MSSEHDDDATIAFRGVGDRGHDGSKVARDEYVWKRVEKCAERVVAGRGMREVSRAHLVGPHGHRNRPYSGEIGFAVGIALRTYFVGAAVAAGAGRCDVR